MDDSLDVFEDGHRITFTFEDLMRYHGPGYPGGVAHAFKVMERALPLLEPDGPLERREVSIRTSFGGPGARDAFEMVLRTATGDRYVVDQALACPERGTTLERYVFGLTYRDRTVTLVIREGFVTDEFIALSRKEGRTPDEDAHLAVLKQEMADRLLARPA
ncbi:MAG TPA: hypothetical protein VF244_04760, partial [Acidimicrobiales bacterium]